MTMSSAAVLLSLLCLLSLMLLLYTYKGFDLLLSLLSRHRSLHHNTAFEPTVSIFIPAYNEEKVIAAKIENCLALDYPRDKTDIMVCSDCSSDATVAIAERYRDQGIRVFDYRKRAGKTGLINSTIPQAQGDIVVFTDANTMFEPGAIRSMVSCYTTEHIGAVLGQVQLVLPAGGTGVDKEIAYREFESRLKFKEGLFGAAVGGFGGFYSIRKSSFTPLPANAYSNDDLLIPARLLARGSCVVFDPLALSHEETGVSVTEEFRRRVRIGAGNFQAFFLLLSLLNPLTGWRFLFYVSHKGLRWFSPFQLLFFFATNMALVNKPFFAALFLMQCLFYGCAAAGALLSRLKISIPVFSATYHFVTMNLAIFGGFFRYMRGIKSAAWESTPRSTAQGNCS